MIFVLKDIVYSNCTSIYLGDQIPSRCPVRRIGSGFGYEGEGLCRAEAERAATRCAPPAPMQSRQRPALTGPRCASIHGFSLHANTQVPAHRRDQLERLIRYMARGAMALERLEEAANGDLVYTFTKSW